MLGFLTTSIISIAIIAYTLATIFIVRSIRHTNVGPDAGVKLSMSTALIGLVAHTTYILIEVFVHGSLDFSLSSMSLLVSAIIVFIFLLGCLGLEIAPLGVLVFPLTTLSLIFSLLWSGEETRLSEQALLPLSAFSSHVLIAILAYSFLSIATIQALLYAYQENQFKNRTAPSMLVSLPPLLTMERLLFRLALMGFLLLTLTLLSGALFSNQIFGKPFDFNHHTIFAILGWFTFATLLVKRLKSGIRGVHAAIWAVVGFLLIQLGYFGTKIVSESLNL